ncbi:hypothetical protein C8R44DRAFT_820538 [Mycena epipterygia]|nr:hypothetical protein C8R44DRAFT_820538 [Mycena epipterygia]
MVLTQDTKAMFPLDDEDNGTEEGAAQGSAERIGESHRDTLDKRDTTVGTLPEASASAATLVNIGRASPKDPKDNGGPSHSVSLGKRRRDDDAGNNHADMFLQRQAENTSTDPDGEEQVSRKRRRSDHFAQATMTPPSAGSGQQGTRDLPRACQDPLTEAAHYEQPGHGGDVLPIPSFMNYLSGEEISDHAVAPRTPVSASKADGGQASPSGLLYAEGIAPPRRKKKKLLFLRGRSRTQMPLLDVGNGISKTFKPSSEGLLPDIPTDLEAKLKTGGCLLTIHEISPQADPGHTIRHGQDGIQFAAITADDLDEQDAQPTDVETNSPAKTGQAGIETAAKWESPVHSTRLRLRLKLSPEDEYTVTICYKFKFTINSKCDLPVDPENLERPLSQPEVVALIDFKVETQPGQTHVDQSYVNMGVMAHRKKAIVDRHFLHRGFDRPDKTYKVGRQQQTSKGLTGVLGFISGHPVATATFTYGKSDQTTVNADDTKPMPRCLVDYSPGEEWDTDTDSYTSYNITCQPQAIRIGHDGAEFHPLDVKVGMGINVHPSGLERPLPKISFINRNQILIRVVTPASKTEVRGIVVLISNYFENVRSDKKMVISEEKEVNLTIASVNVSEAADAKAIVQAPYPAQLHKLGAAPAVLRSPILDPVVITSRLCLLRDSKWRRVLLPTLGMPTSWMVEWQLSRAKAKKRKQEKEREHKRESCATEFPV